MTQEEAIILATVYIQENHPDKYVTDKPIIVRDESEKYFISFDKVILSSIPTHGLAKVDKITGHIDWVPLR